MVVDEKDFRFFISNLDRYTDMSSFNGQGDTEEYQILKNRVFNQVIDYIKILQTTKPSRWKQLTIKI